MLLFGIRKDINFNISEKQALASSCHQAIELILNLVDDGVSYIALKDENNIIKIRAVKKYLFFIEVPLEHLFGSKEGYFTRRKVRNLIKELYHDKKIKDIPGLIFKPYL